MRAGLAELAARTLAAGTLDGLPEHHWIDGRWQPARAGGTLDDWDAGRGMIYARFAAGDADDVADAVASARAALRGPWGQMTPAERGRILLAGAEAIRRHADRLAVAESLDVGKPVGEACGDVRGAARAFEYYAGAVDKLQGDSIPLGQGYVAFTVNEPVGVVAQVIPWNYPLSTAARGIAPALAAGCTVVAKPAEQTPMTALLLAEILAQAGLPPGVLNVVTGTGAAAGAPLVAHPGIDHVTFTGSVATGRRVMQAAAENITSVTLELGGKSPVVVLADCDVDQAVDGVIGAIFENAGQICSAGARLVVERAIHRQMVDRLVARAAGLAMGHGLRNPALGPLNSTEHRDRVAGHIARARARGRTPLVGGDIAADPLTGQGWFFQPTIFDDVDAADPLAREEIFGPVLTVQIADDAGAALRLANATDFGLVAGVYTRDIGAALALARDIDAGQIYINEYFAGGIETPFGGNRLSGFGREKGLEALRAYAKVKCVTARI